MRFYNRLLFLGTLGAAFFFWSFNCQFSTDCLQIKKEINPVDSSSKLLSKSLTPKPEADATLKPEADATLKPEPVRNTEIKFEPKSEIKITNVTSKKEAEPKTTKTEPKKEAKKEAKTEAKTEEEKPNEPSKREPRPYSKIEILKTKFDTTLKEGDYPEACTPYLPVMRQIEMDSEKFLEMWQAVSWNFDAVSNLFQESNIHQLLRVRVEGGTVQVVEELRGTESRNNLTLQLITDAVNKYPRFIPGAEFFVFTGDSLPSPNYHYPLFTFCKRPEDISLLCPDFTFKGWKEALIPNGPRCKNR